MAKKICVSSSDNVDDEIQKKNWKYKFKKKKMKKSLRFLNDSL